MRKEPFSFKREFFKIDGIYNIPGFVILSGYGYDFKTYCCKFCGEIFVVNLESLREITLETLLDHKYCPKCKSSLTQIVKYPENIFYNGQIHENQSSINYSKFDQTELIEVTLIE